MADRAVRQASKNTEGDILALCDEGASWSPRAKDDAIRDIDNNVHTYYVPWTDGRTEIHVANGASGNTSAQTETQRLGIISTIFRIADMGKSWSNSSQKQEQGSSGTGSGSWSSSSSRSSSGSSSGDDSKGLSELLIALFKRLLKI